MLTSVKNMSMTPLNSVGYPPKINRKQPATRLSSLDGKTIYLIDSRFDDSIRLLKEVQAWFTARMPGVKTRAEVSSQLLELMHMIRKGQLGAIKEQTSSPANQFYSLAF